MFRLAMPIGMAMAIAGALLLTGCVNTIVGTATWPGSVVEKAVLTAADFPPGVKFDRLLEQPGQPDGAGGPPAMLSQPEGCSDGLTRVIAASAERGPGSAAKYAVAYDGARMVMTVLSWPLDLEKLAATARRCEIYLTFFDEASEPIPITTTKLPSPRPDTLAYQQTMQLRGSESSVYFAFANVGTSALFGIAYPTPDPTIAVKATLPQTFLDVVAEQSERLG
jgi:hypothetical protein